MHVPAQAFLLPEELLSAAGMPLNSAQKIDF